jgi:hypothetical protein
VSHRSYNPKAPFAPFSQPPHWMTAEGDDLPVTCADDHGGLACRLKSVRGTCTGPCKMTAWKDDPVLPKPPTKEAA